MIISIIVAAACNGVIGHKGGIPWKCAEDLRHFKAKTTGHIVVMGRRTYESIGKPPPNRLNIVMSSTHDRSRAGAWDGPFIAAYNLRDALDLAARFIKVDSWPDEVFIIGGERVYREALPLADKIYLTDIDRDVEGDTFFPPIDMAVWSLVKCCGSKEHDDVTFNTYRRRGLK